MVKDIRDKQNFYTLGELKNVLELLGVDEKLESKTKEELVDLVIYEYNLSQK